MRVKKNCTSIMLVSRYSSETWKSRNNLMQAENELIMVSKKLNGKIQPGPAPLFSPQLYKNIYTLNRIKIKNYNKNQIYYNY